MTRADRLERIRKKLIQRREDLRHRGGRSHSNDSAVGDAADIAQYNVSSDMNTHFESMEADELSLIELALKKFHADEYGVCEYTGKSIPIERLEALPLTRFSVEAQRESEQEITS